MTIAMDEAKAAAELDEVPVGAVIVRNDEVIARAHNLVETRQDPTAHAEMLALKEASDKLNTRRLSDCTMYVTLEPCPMCAGAIINSRVRRLVFGAKDAKAGSCGSVVDMFALPYNHKPEVTAGVLEKECSELLTDFFEQLREKHKKEKENIKL